MNPVAELAALLHPLPEPGSVSPAECFDDAREDTEQARKEFADNLQAASLGLEADPLLLALEEAYAQKRMADWRIRNLLAYAREFHAKGRYSLKELGDLSGYTFSGVRTAYGKSEIAQIEEQIGRAPRRGAREEDTA
ncbi:hypothetical protein [Streptomyces sp. NPDC050485]|uniref:hypothetical protein n=1 Tax=Streptomyces sp. NPDC050485 TaxID=3365617 RepID=UPI00378E4FCD